MLREFDPERSLSPLLQIERTTIGDVPSLFCFQATCHIRVIYHEDLLSIEDERTDVHVACTDQADGIVDGQELGMEKVFLVQVDLDPRLKKLLIAGRFSKSSRTGGLRGFCRPEIARWRGL